MYYWDLMLVDLGFVLEILMKYACCLKNIGELNVLYGKRRILMQL